MKTVITNKFRDTNIYHPQRTIYISRKNGGVRDDVALERDWGFWDNRKGLGVLAHLTTNELESAFPYYSVALEEYCTEHW